MIDDLRAKERDDTVSEIDYRSGTFSQTLLTEKKEDFSTMLLMSDVR
jgi:hypothetical protein